MRTIELIGRRARCANLKTDMSMERRQEAAASRLEADNALLETLPGYQNASELQQNKMRGTLVVQELANLPADDDNLAAREEIRRMYCYAAVGALENGGVIWGDGMPFMNPEFFKGAVYARTSDLGELETMIENIGYPCVVFVGEKDPRELASGEADVQHYMHHAALALGRDNSGDMRLWEKTGGGVMHPYHLGKLREMFEHFSKDGPMVWSVRPLREG